jgi:cbb3-type cytochrome oxidase maturation protein
MNGMAIIIAAALGFGLASLCILLWALQSGQYEDLDGDAQRILIDDLADPRSMPNPPK